MNYIFLSNLYLPLIVIAAVISLSQWRILSEADKWMSILLVITIIQECVSRYMATKGNNFICFHIYTPVELFMISMYFDRSIGLRPPYRIGAIVGITGMILATVNLFYFQPFTQINSYLLMFEACVILSFCMLSFYRLLIRDNIYPGRMTHFWLTLCFLFFFSLTFVIYGLYGAMIGHDSSLAKIFDLTLYFANFSLYLGIGLVFFRYKKMIPSGE